MQQMTTNSCTGETFRQKILLAFLDKGVLALVAAAVGFIFSQQLNLTKATLEYQKDMFAERREVYVQLLVKAQVARDHVLLIYPEAANLQTHEGSAKDWQNRLNWVESQIYGSGKGGSFGAGWWLDLNEVRYAIQSIRDIDGYRKSNAILISQAIDDSIDIFIVQLSKDIEMLIKSEEMAQNKKSQVFELEAPLSAKEAYGKLLRTIRESLKIEDIIIG